MKRFLPIFAAIALLVGLMAPASVSATYSGNLAGRPINGNAAQTCQGTVYGRVNGFPVLYTAYHCVGTGNVLGPNGTVIGSWGGNEGAAYDLGYIYLNPGNWPTNPYQVYRGGGTWWSNQNKWPPSTHACLNIDNFFPPDHGVNQNFQPSNTSTNLTRYGAITGYYQYGGTGPGGVLCSVQTNIPYQPSYKDSGSSFVLDGAAGEIWAEAWGRNPATGKLFVSPLYGGIYAIRNYWLTRGAGVGAWLCTAVSGSGCN